MEKSDNFLNNQKYLSNEKLKRSIILAEYSGFKWIAFMIFFGIEVFLVTMSSDGGINTILFLITLVFYLYFLAYISFLSRNTNIYVFPTNNLTINKYKIHTFYTDMWGIGFKKKCYEAEIIIKGNSNFDIFL